MFSYSSYSLLIGNFINSYNDTFKFTVIGHESRTILGDAKNIFNAKDNRSSELKLGFEKFLEYPKLKKLFGTGWYSSRITRNLDSEELIKKRINHQLYEVNYLQAGVALLLDTGLIGCLILFLLIYKNFYSL